jgi:hypothetical protein
MRLCARPTPLPFSRTSVLFSFFFPYTTIHPVVNTRLLAPLAPWANFSITVSENLDAENYRALEDKRGVEQEAVRLSRTAAGAVAQPLAFWQWHVEHFLAKGNSLDPVYLRNWYTAAAEFYKALPWQLVSNKVLIPGQTYINNQNQYLSAGHLGCLRQRHWSQHVCAVGYRWFAPGLAHVQVVKVGRPH